MSNEKAMNEWLLCLGVLVIATYAVWRWLYDVNEDICVNALGVMSVFWVETVVARFIN